MILISQTQESVSPNYKARSLQNPQNGNVLK
jgi:hypothetical protein